MFRSLAIFAFLFVAAHAQCNDTSAAESDEGFKVQLPKKPNVPKYTFYHANDTNTKYKIMFQKLYESTDDLKRVPSTGISLPSMDWIMEFDNTTQGETVFWFNGTVKANQQGNGNKPAFDVLSFRNVLQNSSFKFDVYIGNYTWQSNVSTGLSLLWKMSSTSEAECEVDHNETHSFENSTEHNDTRFLQDTDVGEPKLEKADKLCFAGGDLCFSVVNNATAIAADGTESAVGVELVYGMVGDDSEGLIHVRYDRFEGSLLHDPQVGMAAAATNSTGTTGGTGGGFFSFIMSFFKGIFGFLGSLFASIFGK